MLPKKHKCPHLRYEVIGKIVKSVVLCIAVKNLNAVNTTIPITAPATASAHICLWSL